MTKSDEDRRLAEAFDALRRRDRTAAPDPEAMLAAARAELEPARTAAADISPPGASVSAPGDFSPPGASGTGPAGAGVGRGWLLVAAAAALAGLLLVGPDRGERSFVAAVESYSLHARSGALSGPTDRLLAVPGSELLGSVPSLGLPGRPLTESGPPGPSPESRR